MFALVDMVLLPAMVVVDSPRTGAQMPVDLSHVSNATEVRGADREDATRPVGADYPKVTLTRGIKQVVVKPWTIP
jgi:hypothetical protein